MASILGNLIVKLTTDDKPFVKGMERGRKHVKRLNRSVSGLAGGVNALIASYVGFRAVTTAADLVQQGAVMEREERRLAKFAGSVDNATAMMAAFNEGAGHTVNRLTALQQASRFINLEIAKTPEQMSKIAEAAIRLGDQTLSAQQRLDQFGSLLANQSRLRLDTFGLSSARVGDRMEELKDKFPEMSKEARFLQATFEEIDKKLATLGKRMDTTADKIERLKAAGQNFKLELGAQSADMIERRMKNKAINPGNRGRIMALKVASVIDWLLTTVEVGIKQMFGYILQYQGFVAEKLGKLFEFSARLISRFFLKLAMEFAKNPLTRGMGLDEDFRNLALAANATRDFFTTMKFLGEEATKDGKRMVREAYESRLQMEAANRWRKKEIEEASKPPKFQGKQESILTWMKSVAKWTNDRARAQIDEIDRLVRIQNTVVQGLFAQGVEQNIARLNQRLERAQNKAAPPGPVRAIEAGSMEAASFISESRRTEQDARAQREQAKNVEEIRKQMESLNQALERVFADDFRVDLSMFGV